MVRQFHLFTIEKEGDLRSKCISISIDSSDQVVQAHRPTIISLTEKGDVEAYPDAVNDPQNETIKNETIRERSLRVLSRTKSAASWKDPGPPPDGGAFAWTQVLVGHLIIMNTW